jgi:hypothetical protein
MAGLLFYTTRLKYEHWMIFGRFTWLSNKEKLLCPHGQHRVKAAEQFLPKADHWFKSTELNNSTGFSGVYFFRTTGELAFDQPFSIQKYDNWFYSFKKESPRLYFEVERSRETRSKMRRRATMIIMLISPIIAMMMKIVVHSLV